MAAFILEDALSVQKDNAAFSPFSYQRRISRLEKLGNTFVVHLVMRLGHKTNYLSKRTILRNVS